MRLAVLITALAVLTVPAVATAHVAPAKGSRQHQLQVRIAHDKGVVAAVDRQAQTAGSAMFIEWSLWLTRQWHARDLAYASAALNRLLLPAHYAGWNCIHGGEGNGYNGAYTGWLGMSTPWMGYSPPGSDWVHSDKIAVFRIAEKVAARYGFSYSFMKGQWPNTYPPCSAFF